MKGREGAASASPQPLVSAEAWMSSLTFTFLFSPVSICWLVGLCAGLHKNYRTYFHETWMKDVSWPKIYPIHFLCWSRWREESRNFFSHFLYHCCFSPFSFFFITKGIMHRYWWKIQAHLSAFMSEFIKALWIIFTWPPFSSAVKIRVGSWNAGIMLCCSVPGSM